MPDIPGIEDAVREGRKVVPAFETADAEDWSETIVAAILERTAPIILAAERERLVEPVAQALYEHATWHPPKPGWDWDRAVSTVQWQWREEARALLAPGEEG